MLQHQTGTGSKERIFPLNSAFGRIIINVDYGGGNDVVMMTDMNQHYGGIRDQLMDMR